MAAQNHSWIHQPFSLLVHQDRLDSSTSPFLPIAAQQTPAFRPRRVWGALGDQIPCSLVFYLLLGVIIISPTPCQGHDYHQSTIYFEPMMPKPFNHGLNASGYFAHTFTSHALLEKRISFASPRRFTALMRAFSVHSCAADEIDNITADTITPRKTSAAPWLPSPSYRRIEYMRKGKAKESIESKSDCSRMSSCCSRITSFPAG